MVTNCYFEEKTVSKKFNPIVSSVIRALYCHKVLFIDDFFIFPRIMILFSPQLFLYSMLHTRFYICGSSLFYFNVSVVVTSQNEFKLL